MESKTTFKKLILDDLKSQGKSDIVAKIKSITYESFSGGNAVRVKAIDLNKSQREFLENLLNEYQYGTFDSMTDCQGYKDSPKPRSAKFVQLSHVFSTEVRAKVIAKMVTEWGITDDKSCQEKRHCWLDAAVWRDLNDLEVIS